MLARHQGPHLEVRKGSCFFPIHLKKRWEWYPAAPGPCRQPGSICTVCPASVGFLQPPHPPGPSWHHLASWASPSDYQLLREQDVVGCDLIPRQLWTFSSGSDCRPGTDHMDHKVPPRVGSGSWTVSVWGLSALLHAVQSSVADAEPSGSIVFCLRSITGTVPLWRVRYLMARISLLDRQKTSKKSSRTLSKGKHQCLSPHPLASTS